MSKQTIVDRFKTKVGRSIKYALNYALNSTNNYFESANYSEQPWKNQPIAVSYTRQSTSFTKEDICRFQTNHENGQFYRSAQIAKHMLRSADIQSALSQRVNNLLSKPFYLSEGDDSKQSELFAKYVKAKWSDICQPNVLSDLLRDVVMCGISFAQIVWIFDKQEQRYWPKIKRFDLANVRKDPSTKCYYAQTDNGEVEIELNGGNWLVFRPYSEEESFLYGAIMCLPEWFLAAQYAADDASKFSETRAQGVWTPILPIGWENTPEGKLFMEMVNDIGRRPIIPLPRNADGSIKYDLDIKEPSSTAWQVFQFLISIASQKIMMVLLGQDMTSKQGDTGSYSSKEIGKDVLNILTTHDAISLGDAIRSQVLTWYAVYKKGDSKFACVPCWDCRDPSSLKNSADAQNIAMDAISKAVLNTPKDSLEVVDVIEYYRQFGIPLKIQKKTNQPLEQQNSEQL